MNHHMNRRNWIRTSAMLAGGATLVPGVFNRATAKAMPGLSYSSTVREEVLLAEFPNSMSFKYDNVTARGPAEIIADAIHEQMVATDHTQLHDVLTRLNCSSMIHFRAPK